MTAGPEGCACLDCGVTALACQRIFIDAGCPPQGGHCCDRCAQRGARAMHQDPLVPSEMPQRVGP